MITAQAASRPSSAIASDLAGLSPEYAPTPLVDMPVLARRLGVSQVLIKDEGRRMLGSFKSLGGTYAGLRALARSASMDIAELVAARPAGLPALICASDGNHGLAVAAAARFAGGPARVFLHLGVPQSRAQRIEAQGAEIVWVDGTYDDSVHRAAAAARAGQGLLVADTTDDPNDPVVADVMAGYGVMASEIREQADSAGHERPTHLFVQAGVGGLAAAMAEGLSDWMAGASEVVVVEPESAPAVAEALRAGRAVRVAGALATTAEMLACGEASAPALAVLQRVHARVVTVSEAQLEAAPAILRACGGPRTTTSGAASLAGALADTGLNPDARVLILVTEGEIVGDPAA